MQTINLIKDKKFVLSSYFIKLLKNSSIDFNDLLFLVYFENTCEDTLDIENICNKMQLTEKEVMTSFNKLLGLKYLTLENKKDSDGRRIEIISLEPLYSIMLEKCQEEEKVDENQDIFLRFENEFARPISSMEYEIINAWLEKGFSNKMILSALKEAIYNGVQSLRYIDKILHEWQKKGYTCSEDAQKEARPKQSQELFEYNWLEENE